MSKHTPAPWQIYDDGSSADIAGAKLDIMPPSFDPALPKNRWPFPVASVSKASPNYKANAALMAAAADMLKALQIADDTLCISPAGLSAIERGADVTLPTMKKLSHFYGKGFDELWPRGM